MPRQPTSAKTTEKHKCPTPPAHFFLSFQFSQFFPFTSHFHSSSNIAQHSTATAHSVTHPPIHPSPSPSPPSSTLWISFYCLLALLLYNQHCSCQRKNPQHPTQTQPGFNNTKPLPFAVGISRKKERRENTATFRTSRGCHCITQRT